MIASRKIEEKEKTTGRPAVDTWGVGTWLMASA